MRMLAAVQLLAVLILACASPSVTCHGEDTAGPGERMHELARLVVRGQASERAWALSVLKGMQDASVPDFAKAMESTLDAGESSALASNLALAVGRCLVEVSLASVDELGEVSGVIGQRPKPATVGVLSEFNGSYPAYLRVLNGRATRSCYRTVCILDRDVPTHSVFWSSGGWVWCPQTRLSGRPSPGVAVTLTLRCDERNEAYVDVELTESGAITQGAVAQVAIFRGRVRPSKAGSTLAVCTPRVFTSGGEALPTAWHAVILASEFPQ